MKKNFIAILLLLCISSNLIAGDSIEIDSRWRTVSVKEIAPDGKWSLIYQSNMASPADIYLIQSQSLRKVILPQGVKHELMKENFIISTTENNISISNLITKKSIDFKGVKKYRYFKESHKLLILFQNNQLKVVDFKRHQPNEALIQQEVSDFYIRDDFSPDILFVCNGSNEQSIHYLNINFMRKDDLGKMEEGIERILFAPGRMLAAAIGKSTKGQTLRIIDLDKKENNKIVLPEFKNERTSLLIDFLSDNEVLVQFAVNENSTTSHDDYLDIWNGNDKDLGKKNNSASVSNYLKYYFVFNRKTAELRPLPSGKNGNILSVGNPFYFLQFDPVKLQDYVRYYPKVELNVLNESGLHLLDTIDQFDRHVAVSPNGKYTYYKKVDQWIFLNEKGAQQISFSAIANQQQIVHLPKSDWIYLIADNNIWMCNLLSGEYFRITHFADTNNQINILNTVKSYDLQFRQYALTHAQLKNNDLVFSVFDSSSNKFSLWKFQNKKLKKVITETTQRISHIVWNDHLNTFYYSKEDYFSPPVIMQFQNGKTRKVIESNVPSDLYSWRKQEIISFQDKFGKNLKGILYYPKNFDSSKRYPMITHVYQNQFYNANKFLKPTLQDYMGFNIPLLVERGYFVFLPDTYVSEDGPGLSALDCVTNAVNKVLQDVSAIDASKLGLIGQSFGGYETNFIITQTSLFAAAVSGSGISDLIWDAHSFNYNFRIPLFFRYEHDQLAFGGSFSDMPEKYLNNSPMLFADKVQTPLLSWAGLEDQNVHWENTRHFYLALKRLGKPQIALFYKNEGHSMIRTKEAKDLTYRTMDWFDYHLRNQREINWINEGLNPIR